MAGTVPPEIDTLAAPGVAVTTALPVSQVLTTLAGLATVSVPNAPLDGSGSVTARPVMGVAALLLKRRYRRVRPPWLMTFGSKNLLVSRSESTAARALTALGLVAPSLVATLFAAIVLV